MLMEKFAAILNRIASKKEKVMIYHDTDADGLCSATIMRNYLEKRQVPVYFVYHKDGPRKVNRHMREEIDSIRPRYLVIMDLAFDEDLENIYKLISEKELNDVLIIDHHKLSSNINSYIDKNILVMKPQYLSSIPPEKYPTSKLIYDLLVSLDTSIRKYWWISSLGIIGDSAYSTWQHFIEGYAQKYNVDIEDLIKAEELIDFTISVDKRKIPEIMNLLKLSRGPNGIINKLKEYENVKEEIKRIVGEYKDKAYIDKESKLLIYGIETSLSLISKIANILSQKYPDYVVIVYGESKDDPSKFIFSFRNQSGRVDVADLIKTISNQVPTLEGGGHKPAAGASIDKKYLNIFLNEIKEKIGEKKDQH